MGEPSVIMNARARKGGIDNSCAEVVPAACAAYTRKQIQGVHQNYSYHTLYAFANALDYLLLLIGILSAVAHGTGFPLIFLFLGDLTNLLTNFGALIVCNFNYTQCSSQGLFNGTIHEFVATLETEQNLTENIVKFVNYFVYIACGVFLCATLQVSALNFQAVRQSERIRMAYVRSILRQNIGYHDVTSAGELNARLADDIIKIQDGMGAKVSLAIQHISAVIAGTIIAFTYSWKLSLVSLAVSPLIVESSALFFLLNYVYTKKELDAYAKAGSIVEETISSIRTVVSFAIQNEQEKRYLSNLGDAKAMGMKKGIIAGASIGFLYLTMFSLYAVVFWYGVTLVLDVNDPLTAGDMMVVFFCILIAAYSLGMAGRNFEYFSAAHAAGQKIFSVINRIPPIDIFSEKGLKPGEVNGEIEIRNVDFTYPSRPGVRVLRDNSFTVNRGQTVALVGQSGCGKSTCVELIQRFYDVEKGAVLMDGKNVKDLSVKWLRDQIGVVAQEPILFHATIGENIRWGRDGVNENDIISAAKKANAYDFIVELPKKFDTLVGESGDQLSGGQKQRIAIARAIVRDPSILLLDEATSALDTESESVVQAALDKASAGRTTVVIAHRLSTIRNADKIVAFHEGKVVEEGTHEDLLKLENGVYANLVNMQTVKAGESHLEQEKGSSEKKTYGLSSHFVQSSSTKRRSRDPKSSTLNEFGGRNMGDADYEDEEEDEIKNLPDAPFKRILALNKPEAVYIVFGCLFAAVAGSVDPLSWILFTSIFTIFTEGDPAEQSRLASLYAGLFVVLGVIALFSNILEAALLSKSGMELTTRMRQMSFRAMLRQDMSYFDDHRHSTGALCSRLATDSAGVQGCTGVLIGKLMKNFSALGVTLGISFAYSWELTLCTLAFLPFLAINGFLTMTLLVGQTEQEKSSYEEASKIATEAVINIRTIASLSKEETIFSMYRENLRVTTQNASKRAVFIGLSYGFSQCVIYFAYACVLRLGLYLVEFQVVGFQDIFIVLTAIIFGAMAMCNNSSFAPDIAAAQVSATRMLALIDSKPEIDAYSDEGLKPAGCKGSVEFDKVKFSYPTRRESMVLKGCDFEVPTGSTLALVGQSGCGKSTSIQLIEMFYDAKEGKVTIDKTDVKSLNVSWMRQQMGVVSQMPVLFDLSLKENILLGDKAVEHTDDDVIRVAKEANIHDFVMSLPDGYNTKAGRRGGQLSVGQKQRIAIARALLRRPKILLLDEATSALDTESEQIVQEALDKAREGRTSIIIAHRLSTVKNADIIAVVDNGTVVETGTHDELLRKRTVYYSLVNAQLTHEE